MSHGLSVGVSDHYCVFLNQWEAPVRKWLWVLPAWCHFIIGSFNNKLKSTLDSVAPIITKSRKTKTFTPLEK